MSADVGGQPERREDDFPRGSNLPRQSPIFWASQKNRYLRQLLIRDIESITARRLLVYFTDCNSPIAQIDQNDDKYLIELLGAGDPVDVDLMLETNGGLTDAAEKLVAILKNRTKSLRVVVPRRAKSNGTLIALAASEILMGPASELGPVDPNIRLGDNWVPCHFILKLPQVDPLVLQVAQYSVMQTQKLAKSLLMDGMLNGTAEPQVDAVVTTLSSRDVYHSHGSVIDASEARSLGLKVTEFGSDDDLWNRFWLLRCMYEVDMRSERTMKIFEGSRFSNSIISS